MKTLSYLDTNPGSFQPTFSRRASKPHRRPQWYIYIVSFNNRCGVGLRGGGGATTAQGT